MRDAINLAVGGPAAATLEEGNAVMEFHVKWKRELVALLQDPNAPLPGE